MFGQVINRGMQNSFLPHPDGGGLKSCSFVFSEMVSQVNKKKRKGFLNIPTPGPPPPPRLPAWGWDGHHPHSWSSWVQFYLRSWQRTLATFSTSENKRYKNIPLLFLKVVFFFFLLSVGNIFCVKLVFVAVNGQLYTLVTQVTISKRSVTTYFFSHKYGTFWLNGN